MKIGCRKEIPLAVFNPGFPPGILALGTMPVAAGVITDANVPARIAPVKVPAQCTCTAPLKRSQGTVYICIGMALLLKLLSVTFYDLCQFKGRPQTFVYNRSSGLNRLVRLGFAT